jgi:hypothetical protein
MFSSKCSIIVGSGGVVSILMPFDFVILDLCPIKSTAYTRLSISVPEINTMHLVKIQLYSGGQFYWSRELEYPVNVTNLS